MSKFNFTVDRKVQVSILKNSTGEYRIYLTYFNKSKRHELIFKKTFHAEQAVKKMAIKIRTKLQIQTEYWDLLY